MPDGEPTPGEIWRRLDRIERLLEALVSRDLYQATIEAMDRRLEAIEDTQKWFGRFLALATLTIMGNLILSLLRA